MPQKLFLPFLTDETGRSLTVENGVVVTRAIPAPQENSPEGWEKSTVQFARNNEFRAMFKSYTTALKFFLDAARILREFYYRKGIEVTLYFIWLKLNQQFGGDMKYMSWYKGEPDFSTFKDTWDGVTINITEGGFYKDLTANKDIVYEIPVVDDDTAWLYMDGIVVKQEFQYEDTSGVEVSINLYGQNFLGPYTLVGQDGQSVNVLAQSETLESVGAFATIPVSLNHFFQNLGKTVLPVRILGTLEFKCTGMTSEPAYAIRFRYMTSNSTIANQAIYDIYQIGLQVGVTYTHPIDMTINLQPGETLMREGIFFGGPGVDAKIEFTENSKTSISFNSRKEATVVPTQTVYNLGNKLTKKISKNVSTLDSPFLQSNPMYTALLVTPGDALRGIDGAVIKTKFTDYHKSVDATHCIALEVVGNNPSIKSRYDKFDNTTIAPLGECRNWTCYPATDYMYDSIEAGYPKKDPLGTDNVNGRLSFLNTYLWKTPLSRVKNTYKMQSVYLADPYVIESFRINFDKKKTTDSTSDNDVFFLDAEPKTDATFTGDFAFVASTNSIILSGGDTTNIAKYIKIGMKVAITGSANNNQVFTIVTVVSPINTIEFTVLELVTNEFSTPTTLRISNLYQLRRKPYAAVNGVPAGADLFNIELSVARIMALHWRWIKSGIEHFDTDKITFQSTDKNADFETIDLAGVTITEKADIPISIMGARVFLPHYFEFEVESPFNLYELMQTNNSGHFDYFREGLGLEGFPIDIKTNEATLETQVYKLLATANVDLTKLINNR